jgi:hypothetical protein
VEFIPVSIDVFFVEEPVEISVGSSTEVASTSTSLILPQSATSTEPSDIASTTVSTTTASTTALRIPYALVDGVVVAVTQTEVSPDAFSVRLEGRVFDIGEHFIELYLINDATYHKVQYRFAVAGTLVSDTPLIGDLFATVIADTTLQEILWLKTYASGTVYSFEKVADESTMQKNPKIDFYENSIFWLTPDGEAAIGFDVSSKSHMSQTIQRTGNIAQGIVLQNKIYSVVETGGALEVEYRPTAPSR